MFELAAVLAAFSFGFGTFLTKGVTSQISFLKSIGPLFLLNALFATPIALYERNWILFDHEILYLHLIGAIISGGAAVLIFGIIARSTASVAAIPQTLTPAVVLVLAPIFLSTSVTPAQIIFVIVLIFGSIYPLRKSIPGLRSGTTLAMTLTSGIASGAVTINIALLGQAGVTLSETLIVRQLVAGLVLMALFPPKGVNKKDLIALIRRASFMSIGWVTYIYAIQNGNVLVIQSIMVTVSLWVIAFEVISQRKRPEKSTLAAVALAVVGVIALILVS